MTKFTKSNWMTRGLQEKLNVVGEQFRLVRFDNIAEYKKELDSLLTLNFRLIDF
mgnify:CR=1 FL=1